ncbi:MAG TPA: patatin-like phospholipase family protein [Ilumatobacteraceae bacterium]|nr:patatin-like phospholipase family protein [Ilumatobacteraceae bacterium]
MQIDTLRSLPRPLAFILPGGGALASYQVGVLDALTAAGLQPDRLIGVSAGSMNAAMFAWSADMDGVRRLERLWVNVRRRDLLRMHPGRVALALAGKRASFLDNRHGIAFLRKHFGARLIQHAPTPLTIIATDLATGRPFVLESGDVVSAIVASSAFPGVFPPVEVDGHTLIDGGVVADVPLDVAAELGVASAIVLTVPPLAPGPAPQHPVAVVLRSSTWGVEAHGRTIVARPPNGLRVVEIPTQPSSVTTFAVGSAASTIEDARVFTAAWLRSE